MTSTWTLDTLTGPVFIMIDILILFYGVIGTIRFFEDHYHKFLDREQKFTVKETFDLSLGISDIISWAMILFSIIVTANASWIFGVFWCKFIFFVLLLNMFSSIFVLVLNSVDGCMWVCEMNAVVLRVPFLSQENRTQRKAVFAVVLVWLVSILVSVPTFVVRDVSYNKHTQVYRCYNNFNWLHSYSSTILPVFHFLLGFVIPLVIISVCYTIVKNQRNMASNHLLIAREVKYLGRLVVMLVISGLPYHIIVLLGTEFSPGTFITPINMTVATHLKIVEFLQAGYRLRAREREREREQGRI